MFPRGPSRSSRLIRVKDSRWSAAAAAGFSIVPTRATAFRKRSEANAGENALAAFAPATITLTQTDGAAFSLLSIDLARDFAFDPAPTVTFTGTLVGGGSVTETFSVATPSGEPGSFETFSFTGFTDLHP
jgi:hypothetical protein